MKTLRTIIRAFVLGAIAGLLIAPRAGRETRDMLSERWNNLLDGTPGMNFDDTTSGNTTS
jgi:gas vesicle protein